MIDEADLKQAVTDGIIDRDFHDQLLVKVGHWTRLAGISEQDILLRISHHCTTRERNWFRGYKKHMDDGCYGVKYVGPFKPDGMADVGLRMRALTAGFLRNYTDARIRSCENAIKEDCTILCLPDFGAEPSEYIKQRIGPLLLARAGAGKPTLIHVSDNDQLEAWWGKAVSDLLIDSFTEVDLG